jgi:hypothetical protein
MGAFLLIAAVFVYLLYYGQALAVHSSALR